jgi:hypothetical protein
MTRAVAAGFDDDGECERLGVGVVFDLYGLRDAVVGKGEVFGVEAEDDVAVAAGDEDGNHDEVGADGEFDVGWRSPRLLLGDGGGGERQQERQNEERAHLIGSWTQTRRGRVRLQGVAHHRGRWPNALTITRTRGAAVLRPYNDGGEC